MKLLGSVSMPEFRSQSQLTKCLTIYHKIILDVKVLVSGLGLCNKRQIRDALSDKKMTLNWLRAGGQIMACASA